MKLNIDLGYILKRLIVIGLGFILISQLKSCDVLAQSYVMNQQRCYGYYGTGNTNVQGTLSIINTGASLNMFSCSFGSNSQSYYISRYDVRVPTDADSGTGSYSFYVSSSYPISSVVLTSNSSDYTCDLNTGITDSSNGMIYYSVTCNNVPISSNRAIGVKGISHIQNNITSTVAFINVSSIWNIVLNQDVASAVSDASSQAHSDSQAVQNAVSDVQDQMTNSDVSNDTNSSASSIFNVDIDTSHGLSSIVTAPLTLLAKAQEQCSPKSFTIFHKSITLPCGDSLFWSKDFSSYSSIFGSGVSGSQMNTIRDNFRTFWNVLFGGAIIFHLLVKLWQVINDTLDPTSDRYESMNSAIDTGSMSLRDEDELDIKLDKGSELHNGQIRIRKPVSS